MKYGTIALVFLFIDEILKWTALKNGWAVHRNFGLVFDLPVPSWLVLPATALIILAAGCVLFWRRTERRLSFAIFLIMAGGIGNFLDRIIWGYIVDYLIIFSRTAINLSDLMILFGAVTLIFWKKDEPPVNLVVQDK